MHLWQVSLASDSSILIGHSVVTFGEAPHLNEADSMAGAWFGNVHIKWGMSREMWGNIRETPQNTGMPILPTLF